MILYYLLVLFSIKFKHIYASFFVGKLIDKCYVYIYFIFNLKIVSFN